VPAATTANVAVCPVVTVWFAGSVVIVGATGVTVTVRVAIELDTLPVVLLTRTSNVDPLSEVAVAGVV
jgi:hypothetical protein